MDSPLKSHGSDRSCTDYHKVNSVTKPDCFPFPQIDDSVNRQCYLLIKTRSYKYSGRCFLPFFFFSPQSQHLEGAGVTCSPSSPPLLVPPLIQKAPEHNRYIGKRRPRKEERVVALAPSSLSPAHPFTIWLGARRDHNSPGSISLVCQFCLYFFPT